MVKGQVKELAEGIASVRRGERMIVRSPAKGRGTDDGFPKLFLLKPEILANEDPATLEKVLLTVLRRMDGLNIIVRRHAIFNGSYVRESGFVASNWPILNGTSMCGLEYLDRETRENIRRKVGKSRVLGAHQALREHNELTSYALDVVARSLPITKFNPGIYGTKVCFDGVEALVLNCFHPHQQQWFSQDQNCFVAFEIISHQSLQCLRREFMGCKPPLECAASSLKGTFARSKGRLGVRRFDLARNGFHLSANIVEAALGLKHLFEDDYEIGIHGRDVDAGALFQMVKRRGLTWFRHLEDKDGVEAVKILKRALQN